MRHHAYFFVGNPEEGIAAALAYGARELKLSHPNEGGGNPDIIVLRYGLFSVEDARTLADVALRAPLTGDAKLIIISAERIFHEAQNALLKSFEEPPEGTYLVLIVPSEGAIIPTLRSRLLALPVEGKNAGNGLAEEFLAAKSAGREKIVEKILARAKKDSPEEKQAARIEALAFAQGLMKAVYAKDSMIHHTSPQDSARRAFLEDLEAFVPILHERSAPLKPILEHLLITAP